MSAARFHQFFVYKSLLKIPSRLPCQEHACRGWHMQTVRSCEALVVVCEVLVLVPHGVMKVLAFVLAAWTAEALREEQVTKELSEANVTGGQPGGRLGTVALKTIQQGLKRVRPGQAAKGFQFKAPGGLAHGFHPPNYAFNGLGRGGVGLSKGFGGHLGGMPNQLGRMPLQGVARRIASGNTGQQMTKGVRMIGMQNLEGGQYTELMGRLTLIRLLHLLIVSQHSHHFA